MGYKLLDRDLLVELCEDRSGLTIMYPIEMRILIHSSPDSFEFCCIGWSIAWNGGWIVLNPPKVNAARFLKRIMHASEPAWYMVKTCQNHIREIDVHPVCHGWCVIQHGKTTYHIPLCVWNLSFSPMIYMSLCVFSQPCKVDFEICSFPPFNKRPVSNAASPGQHLCLLAGYVLGRDDADQCALLWKSL